MQRVTTKASLLVILVYFFSAPAALADVIIASDNASAFASTSGYYPQSQFNSVSGGGLSPNLSTGANASENYYNSYTYQAGTYGVYGYLYSFEVCTGGWFPYCYTVNVYGYRYYPYYATNTTSSNSSANASASVNLSAPSLLDGTQTISAQASASGVGNGYSFTSQNGSFYGSYFSSSNPTSSNAQGTVTGTFNLDGTYQYDLVSSNGTFSIDGISGPTGTLGPGDYNFSVNANANYNALFYNGATSSGFTLELTPVATVPEPSTFAIFGMMLALGAGCFFMQRRRVVVPTSVV